MKRKICLVLVFLLFAAGCDVDYTLEMENDEIKENIVIEFEEEDCNEDNIECRQYVEDTLRLTHSVDNYPEYDMEYSEENGNVTVRLQYTYESIDDWKNNNIYETLFNEVQITENVVKLNGYASDTEVGNISNYKVTLQTDRDIKISNASNKDVEGGKYEWNFNSTMENFNIDLEFQEKTKTEEAIDSLSSIFIIVLIIIGILSAIGIICFVFFVKSRHSNKI